MFLDLLVAYLTIALIVCFAWSEWTGSMNVNVIAVAFIFGISGWAMFKHGFDKGKEYSESQSDDPDKLIVA